MTRLAFAAFLGLLGGAGNGTPGELGDAALSGPEHGNSFPLRWVPKKKK